MLGATRAQIWAYSPRFRRPRHFHAEPELNLVAAGTAVFSVGEKRITVQARECLSFAPGQDHLLEGGSTDLVLFAIGPRSDYSEQILGNRQPDATQCSPVRLPQDAFRDLIRRVEARTEQEGIDSQIGELWEQVRHTQRHLDEDDSSMHVLTWRALSALLRNPRSIAMPSPSRRTAIRQT